VLKSPPGELLSGFVFLFLMGFFSTQVSVGGAILQLGSSLMVFVV
jgi:hypothetical protein